MQRKRIRHFVVVGEGRLVGALSERGSNGAAVRRLFSGHCAL